MRTLKFRAWDGKQMIGTYDDHQTFAIDLSGNPFSYGHGNTPFTHYAQDDLVLMQYTGLKDKSGNKIYEGDIILVHGGYEKGAVEYRNGSFVLSNTDKQVGHFIADTIDVIGNIYEDPTLLEASSTTV